MNVKVGRATVGGEDGASWGTENGLPLLLIRASGVIVRVSFATAEEARTFGCHAIYLAVDSALAHGGTAEARPASLLFDPSGAPL